MSSDAPAPGTRIASYTLDTLLGQGGFGWVYRATRDDGKSFAVKILKPRYANDPQFEGRFRKEAAVAADLTHPHIVHIEEVGSAGGMPYLAMDLYPDSLSARLARETILDEPTAADIGIDICRALAFAHERQIVHRDIKPDNVLLAANGKAVLADFGLARAVSGYIAATGFMMTIGTPAYISPEQAQGRPVDGRSDLYALGITLYRTLTGDVPFRSRDWFELARLHVEQAPEPPRNRRPELSRRIERIILRLLAKHPDDRYPTAASLIEDLSNAGARSRSTDDIPVPEGYLRPGREGAQPTPEERKRWWRVW